MKNYIVNERIRAKTVRLISSDGGQMGVVSIEQARQLSEDNGLDLLLVSQESDPPVCKLVDIGQFKYKQRKKEKLAKKSSKAQVIKELKMSPKISTHDYQVRVNQGKKFLEKGYNVKLSIFFKGREMAHQDIGRAVIDRYIAAIDELGGPAGKVISGHRSLFVMINPKQ